MYRMDIILYTNEVPFGILTEIVRGQNREDCVQQIVDYIEDIGKRVGTRDLKVRITSEGPEVV